MSQDPFQGLLDTIERIGRGYAEFNRRLAAWQEQVQPAMKRFVEGVLQVGDSFSIWLVLSTITFARGGWSEIPLRNMALAESSRLVERLWDKSDEEVKGELDVAIPEYFRRDDYAPLSEIVVSWYLHFGDRHQVFADALWAHKHRRYTLSIPALAAQVEGIVRDLVEVYDEGPRWRKRFLDTLGHDRENPPVPSRAEELPEFMALPIHERFHNVEELRKHFTLAQIQELFERKKFSDPRSASSVNRHVIVHGVFRNFGEVESLKLFFVLDLLHEATGMYKERTSGQ